MKRFDTWVWGTLCFLLVFVLGGCSAKQEAKFERVTGTICAQARERQALIALGQSLVPGKHVPYAIGLTYRQVLNACDERDEYFETFPPDDEVTG